MFVTKLAACRQSRNNPSTLTNPPPFGTGEVATSRIVSAAVLVKNRFDAPIDRGNRFAWLNRLLMKRREPSGLGTTETAAKSTSAGAQTPFSKSSSAAES